ncbi:uncharacterized protein LOC103940866 [Pyrus x bretschneideri]|uniref:uncharacterized protein LOC103940866 n=1 Tax=Pyrus x bretschneideri TaxID=225117 RepID=UPI00202EE771|nr:uncharacterized protein LOC103940866 [Pyrus x bretschneideri]XP_048421001.1 uncharacterized protein LOC103940866 [Pyrus x bretschneideri]XP_048421002.1 uncharacterized protein LOC103940866 [Pyrus x bretschneideri]
MSLIHGPILTLRAPTAAHISSDGEEKRHQMMQNLFGNQCEEEEEEVNSDDESNPQPKSYWAITRLSIVLLHALLSAETSTGLIKEGYTILLKHFRTITTKCCDYEQERVARADLQLLSSRLRRLRRQ